MPVRRRHPITRSVERRRTTWARQVGTLSNAAVGTYDTVDLLSSFKTAGGTTFGCTVARIHLRLACITNVTAADEFAVGIIKGQDTDVGVTIAGAPEPIAHPYEDWLYWSVFFGSAATTGGAQLFYGGGNNIEIDIKAKRKLEDLQENLNLVTRSPVSTAFPVQMDYSASVLLMLP